MEMVGFVGCDLGCSKICKLMELVDTAWCKSQFWLRDFASKTANEHCHMTDQAYPVLVMLVEVTPLKEAPTIRAF